MNENTIILIVMIIEVVIIFVSFSLKYNIFSIFPFINHMPQKQYGHVITGLFAFGAILIVVTAIILSVMMY